MGKRTETFDEIILRQILRLGKAATIEITNSDGSKSVIDLTELASLDGLTATVDEINQAADISARTSSKTSAYTVASSDNGKTLYFASATGFAMTLPAPIAGFECDFIVATAPTTGNHTVKTNADANIIYGQVCSAEDAAGSVSTAAAADIINFVANKAIIGDTVKLKCDGTNWYITGMCNVQDAITTVQTA